MEFSDIIEEKLEIGFELLKNSLEKDGNIPILTIFMKDNFTNTKVLFPAKLERSIEYTERLKGLSKDYNPEMIVGCEPIDKKEYDGLIIAVHVDSKKNRCFYHKKKSIPTDGWEETFEV